MSVEFALQYAARGWRVFPVGLSKRPFKGSHGLLDATSDKTEVEKLWAGRGRQSANVALALDDLLVLDADGADGLAMLRQIANESGPLPRTLVCRTPRGGLHLYYRLPEGEVIRSHSHKRDQKGDDGLDWKAAGGYVLLPPSRTAAGEYRWLHVQPIAEAPVALLQWLREHGGGGGAAAGPGTSQDFRTALGLGERPEFLSAQPLAVPTTIAPGLDRDRYGWTPHEEARLRAALATLPAVRYDDWYQFGMALQALGWERQDGTSISYDIWRDWSATCPDKFSDAGCEQKWTSFGKNTQNRRTISVASIYHKATEAGWDGKVSAAAPAPHGGNLNGVNGSHALPAVLTQQTTANGPQPIIFPDTNRMGRPVATCPNARVAIRGLGVGCRYDLFHDRMTVGGHAIDQYQGEITENVVQALRSVIHRTYGFDPGPQHAHDAAVQECLEHAYDPVANYLDGLHWDKTPRLLTWLHHYLGADDTPLNRAIGVLTLTAAVRRIRQPGAKFDQIVVLESPEGKNKSTAIEILAGSENFSDQTILTLDDKGQQEALRGVWLYEIADLTGMSRADVEKVKAFASRKVDRARPAYGRKRIDIPRRSILFATTNETHYLKSETGNRRFWPVQTGTIDLDALTRDRDQLWAEASAIERTGTPVSLPPRYWVDAAELQNSRREADPWLDILEDYHPKEEYAAPDGSEVAEWRVSSRDFLDLVLRIPTERQGVVTARRLAFTLKKLGWDGPKPIRRKGSDGVVKGYSKPVTAK